MEQHNIASWHNNKRPRHLDTLLGHMPFKLIRVNLNFGIWKSNYLKRGVQNICKLRQADAQPFLIYCAFYKFPIDYHLERPKKDKHITTKEQKDKNNIKTWNIAIFPTLVETLSSSIHEFWLVNLICTFWGDAVWNFFSHMVPKRKNYKNSNLKVSQIWTTFVGTLNRSIHEILEMTLQSTFRGDVPWNISSHMVPC